MGPWQSRKSPEKAFSREKTKVGWHLDCHQLYLQLLDEFLLRKRKKVQSGLKLEFGEEIWTISSKLVALELNKCIGKRSFVKVVAIAYFLKLSTKIGETSANHIFFVIVRVRYNVWFGGCWK